jgi:excisionase family DNA binding protein
MAEEPVAYRPAEALKVFPIGRTALYERLASGEIASFRVGRARFIPRQSLLDFMERSLREQGAKQAS